MTDRADLTGLRFGRMLVISISHIDKHGLSYWLCHCDCDGKKIVRGAHLISGKIRSCRCLNRELAGKRAMRHGHTANGRHPPEYRAWEAMKNRCYNPNDPRYQHYGARGITVCERWRNSFETFLVDMGPRPPGLNGKRALYSIDRIDNDGNYEPGNCKWRTAKEQRNNRR